MGLACCGVRGALCASMAVDVVRLRGTSLLNLLEPGVPTLHAGVALCCDGAGPGRLERLAAHGVCTGRLVCEVRVSPRPRCAGRIRWSMPPAISARRATPEYSGAPGF